MEDIIDLRYALDTFYFLVMGAFVMWMAAGRTIDQLGHQLERPTDWNWGDIRICIPGQPLDVGRDSNLGRSTSE